MNKDDSPSRLSRLSAILIMLQSKKIVTATHIAEKFGISIRTAYRDIKALEASGVPLFTEEGKGYSLMSGYTLPPVMFTEKEANALITAANMIARNKDQSLVKNHNNAVTKIRAVLKYANKNKAELLSERVAFFNNLSNEKSSDSLSSIQLAITNLRLVKIKYQSIGKNELTFRTLEPQALYQTRENWILIAWCHLRNDYREFRLDKIQTIEFLNEKFDDRRFNLMDYFLKQKYFAEKSNLTND